MQIRLCVFLIIISGSLALAESKGYCPAPPPVSALEKASMLPAGTDKITVPVLTVISDSGYVCSAQVSQKVDKELGLQAVSAVRKRHFAPAKKNGRGVPVVIIVAVNFKRDKGGKLILASDIAAPKP